MDSSTKTEVIYVTVDEAKLNDLRAENERLTYLLTLAREEHEQHKAENERLRAALTEIAAATVEYKHHNRHAYTLKCIERALRRVEIDRLASA